MSESESIGKKLILSIVPMFFGSFLFTGLIENFKADSNLKIKILEEYFKPTRQTIFSCQKMHNDLFLNYQKPSANLRLFAEEIIHLIDNPSLNGSRDYGLLLEALAKSYQNSLTEINDLESKVAACRIESFRELETLSIATGSFNNFTKFSEIRADEINTIYKSREDKRSLNSSSVDTPDPKEILRTIVTMDIESKEGQEKVKVYLNKFLPFIEKNAEIMSLSEEQIYKSEDKFYSKVREETSIKLNNMYKNGFVSSILKI